MPITSPLLQATLLFPLILGTLGAVVGSFLNVVIYRLPREHLSVLTPRRSQCPQCLRQIPWAENLPIVSWLVLGARCRGCRTPIPLRYLLVELLTAFLFGYAAIRFAAGGGMSMEAVVVLLAHLLLLATCVAVTYIDIDFKIIPDEITWPGMGLGLLLSAAAPRLQAESWLYLRLAENQGMERHLAGIASSAVGLLVGVGIVWGVGLLGSLAFRKEAMGLGDVKYLGMVGAFLGFDGVLLVFFLGSLAGAVGGLLQRWVTGDRYIAFGPYLSLGVVLVIFFQADLVYFFTVGWPNLIRRAVGLEGLA